MQFVWDEKKRLSNLEKHGLDFIDVIAVFKAPHLVIPSSYEGGEKRFLAVGQLESRFVTVIYTHRDRAIRIISFRRARHEERQGYQKLFGGRA
jgi:hypothetical protein